jgi:hypothetical protein
MIITALKANRITSAIFLFMLSSDERQSELKQSETDTVGFATRSPEPSPHHLFRESHQIQTQGHRTRIFTYLDWLFNSNV